MRKATEQRSHLITPLTDIAQQARTIYKYADKYGYSTQDIKRKLAIIIVTANDLKELFQDSIDGGQD